MEMDAEAVIDALKKHGLNPETLLLILNSPFAASRIAHQINEVAEIMRLVIGEQEEKGETYWETIRNLPEGLDLEIRFALAQKSYGEIVRRRNRADLTS